MGLNHQLAALSCAIAEAYFLNRTLLFPKALCTDVKHEKRWLAAGRKKSVRCDVGSDTGFSVPTASLIDLDALARLVRIELVELRTSSPQGGGQAVEVDRSWKSERIARELPCSRAPLVRRRVSGFWFRPCAYKIVQCGALAAALDVAVGAGGAVRSAAPSALVPHVLRSGLFYTAPIRAAAAAVRRALGGRYTAVHVRRSDRLHVGCGKDCARVDALTQPEALLARLRAWYAPGTRVYVGSTEPPAYFAPLRRAFNLSFAEDFRAGTSLGALPSNYALYAAETLVFFGAASMVETFGSQTSWITHACFPAMGLRGNRDHAKKARRGGGGATSAAVHIDCMDARGVVANGVYYGRACVANPPCGEAMNLIPEHNEGLVAPKLGCGRILDVERAGSAAGCDVPSRFEPSV